MINALYLHVPFCEHICYYCDFKRSVYQEEVVDAWLRRLEQDLLEKKINPYLKTIYIGGGTPTALNLKQMTILLNLLRPYTSEIEEYTIESNLESIDRDKLQVMKDNGVNRISLGVQSYDDDLLVYTNRRHKREDITKTITLIYEYIDNISIDLMYGFQNQSIESWKDSLEQAMKDDHISHVSIYSLTIEEHSVFGKQKVKPIENEIDAEMYELAITYLETHGYHQYEVANFAKTNRESKHNQYYWRYDDFYGIGIGASGKEGHRRYTVEGTMKEYIEERNEIIIENLSKKDEVFECFMMNIRLKKGIDISLFTTAFQIDFKDVFRDSIAKSIEKGYLVLKNENLAYTQLGLFYLHDVLVMFMEEADEREDNFK